MASPRMENPSTDEIYELKRLIQQTAGWNDLKLQRWWNTPSYSFNYRSPREISKDHAWRLPFIKALKEFIRQVEIYNNRLGL